MSLSIRETISCPHCGEAREVSVWTSVNADLNPELKAKLLEGSLLRYECPECGASSEMDRELLYHDMGRRSMIQRLMEGASPPDLSSLVSFLTIRPGRAYTLRVVRTLPELIEKVAVLDARLDDRVVEAYKAMLAERLRQKGVVVDRILYLRPSEATPSKVRWRIMGDEPREVETEFREGYEEMRRELRSSLDAEPRGLRWREVNERYFVELVDGQAV